jgi:tetratricopeptide (TPR) repeat protein/membrane protease YdiL (CAAX protease family)
MGQVEVNMNNPSESDAPPPPPDDPKPEVPVRLTAMELWARALEESPRESSPTAPPTWIADQEDSAQLTAPGFWGAVGWLIVFTLLQGLGGCLLASEQRKDGDVPASSSVVLAAHLVSFLLITALVWRRLGAQPRRMLALRKASAFHLFLVILLVPPLVVLAGEISKRATQVLDATPLKKRPQPGPEPPEVFLPARTSAYITYIDDIFARLARQPWLVAFLVICLLPGLGEEMFFRAFLGRGLVARHQIVLGTVLTAFLFALAHIDPVQASYCLVLGIVLQMVFLTTKSLWPAVLLHMLFNFVGLVQTKLAQEGTVNLNGPDGNLDIPLGLVLAAALAVVALGTVLYQTRTRWFLPDGNEWSPGYNTAEMPPASLGALPRQGGAGLRARLLGAGAYAVFGAGLAYAMAGWLDPNSAWACTQRAEAYQMAEEYDQAIAECDQAIQANPGFAPAYAIRAEAYRMKGDNDRALADCNRALELDPAHALPYTTRGNVYLAREAYDRAIDDLDKAIALDPSNAHAYACRGAANRLKGEHARAQVDCDRAIQLDPKLAHAYANRALIYQAKKDHQRALADWNKAIELDPQLGWACTNRGIIYEQRGEHEQAMADWNQAIRLDPEDAVALAHRGEAYRAKGDPDRALADLDRAIRLDPSNALAYTARAEIYRLRLAPDQALADCNRAIHLLPQSAWAHSIRGAVYQDTGQYAKAIADWEYAIHRDPEQAWTYRVLAWLRATCPKANYRDGQQAVEHASCACNLTDWKDGYCLAALAAAYAECGNFGEARKVQKKALAAAEDDQKEFFRMLADLYKANKPFHEQAPPKP